MAKFKIGDVVQLNSGSPEMTIREYENDFELVCNWFEFVANVKNSLEVGVFHEDQLSEVKRDY